MQDGCTKMNKMNQTELTEIIRKHEAWRRGAPGGAPADLSLADLDGSDLSRADLTRANFEGASLRGAKMVEVRLVDAFLADATFTAADLTGASMVGADLVGANLAMARLVDADLAGSDLTEANLDETDLHGTYVAGASLADAYIGESAKSYQHAGSVAAYLRRAARYRRRHPEVPVIPDLDKRILELVSSDIGAFDMSLWHTCETTHCRAGWAIVLAGEAGRALELHYGPATAGRMIYLASTGRSAHFFTTTEHALRDIQARVPGPESRE